MKRRRFLYKVVVCSIGCGMSGCEDDRLQRRGRFKSVVSRYYRGGTMRIEDEKRLEEIGAALRSAVVVGRAPRGGLRSHVLIIECDDGGEIMVRVVWTGEENNRYDVDGTSYESAELDRIVADIRHKQGID